MNTELNNCVSSALIKLSTQIRLNISSVEVSHFTELKFRGHFIMFMGVPLRQRVVPLRQRRLGVFSRFSPGAHPDF